MQVIGSRYELRGLLGEGGMGAVHRGWDLVLHREVAIKLLRGGLDEVARPAERFLREARSLARVKSPHVVQVFDCGTVEGQLFLAMELVDGESLDELLRRDGPLPMARALSIVRDVARGLEAAHVEGVIHRDIKPENIVIGRDGRVVVIDFGIAHVVGEERFSGQVRVGTLANMAPEQIEGLPPVPATDVWGLGLLLHRLLTNRHPFPETDLGALLRAITTRPPVAPSAVVAGSWPAALDAIVVRALAKRPEERFVDAAVFGRALDSIGAEQTPVAHDGGVPRLWVPFGHHDTPLGIMVGGGFFVGPCVTGGAWRLGGRTSTAADHDVVTGVSHQVASAWAASVGGRIPTDAEWSLLAAVLPALDSGRCWEWTSTPFGGIGYIVRGGQWRDRPGVPPSRSNASFENQAASDVGWRVIYDR